MAEEFFKFQWVFKLIFQIGEKKPDLSDYILKWYNLTLFYESFNFFFWFFKNLL